VSSYLELDQESANRLLSALLKDKNLKATIDVAANRTVIKCERPVAFGLLSIHGEVSLSGARESDRRCVVSLQPINTTLKGAQVLWKGVRWVKGLVAKPEPVVLTPGVSLTSESLTIDLDGLERADLPDSARRLVERLEITEFSTPGANGAAVTVGFRFKE
jgi:hypothetical protein